MVADNNIFTRLKRGVTLLWRFKIRDFTLSSLFEGDINLQIKHVVTFELIFEVERNATNLLKRETFAKPIKHRKTK